MGQVTFGTVKIPSGDTASNVINVSDHAVAGIIFPAAFTGTEVSIQARADIDQPWVAISAPVISTTVSTYVLTSTLELYARFSDIRLVSQAAEGAVRELKVGMRRIY